MRTVKWQLGWLSLLASGQLFAQDINREGVNLTRGVTEFADQVYELHMLILWICVVIGIGVFGAMFYSMYAHRKSKGYEAAQFSHSTKAEIAWTVIPILILVFMAVPATKVLIDMEQTADAEITVKITGFQWGWKYEYIEDEIEFVSVLDRASNRARLKGSDVDLATLPNYLIDVDKPLYLPTDTKIRFVLTADDVIHAWWVPALGWKRDAIPGLVNEAWTQINTPGTYRGQCAELCGKDHGFMPIVVVAQPMSEFRQWVAEQKADEGAGEAMIAATGSAASATPAAALQAVAETIVPAAQASEVAADDASADAEQSGAAALAMDQLMDAGKKAYQAQCVACHQLNGEGLPPAFPSLAGSEIVNGPIDGMVSQLLNGVPGTAMLSFKDILSEEDIAATITYVRNSFGNETGDMIQPADIAAAKQGN